MGRVRLAPSMTFGEAVEAATGAAGDAWLAADGERATLRELVDRADALAARLRGAGVHPGQHVGVLLPNGVRYAEAFLAVVRLGAVVVPLDPQLPDREFDAVARAVPLAATLAERPRPLPGAVAGTVDAGGWRLPGTPERGAPARPRRDETAAVFLTSGTTGEPKPVPLTHHQLVRPLVALQRLHAAFFAGSPLQTAARVATVGRRHGTRLLRAAGRQTWCTATPFRGMAGHQVFAGSLLLGHNLVTARAFHPRRTLELADAHRVNVLACTPAMVELLLRVGDVARYDLSSLLVIGVGGGPAAPDLVERAQRRFGCAVTVGYGSTELGGGVLATRLEDSPHTQTRTVGRPFPGAEVRVVDADGADVPAGRAGELLCRTRDDGPWLATGDLARRDTCGNVEILGRADDLVVRGGQNVHPLEVERAVEELSGVRRCAVVGVGSPAEQQLWAFVVPEDGHELGPDAVRRHCRTALAPARQPDRVRIVPALPVTEHGEVRRNVLRAQAGEENV
ncbi:MAG: acyl--CoA ligase [Pseudonocardia sp.]|nr:acyl--CoA ligase [Pseudonocardia sp.]